MLTKFLRFLDYLAWPALACLYLLGLWLISANPAASWVDLITDDAYYYLGIVRSIVEAGASSFLPPFETNGYQPLWVMLLSATGFVFGVSEKSLALQAFTLCFAFVGLFAYLSRRHYGLAFPAILSATVFSFVTLEGMETAMMGAFVLAFFQAAGWKSRGIFSSLLFLTRLDALSLVAARDVYYFLVKKERDLRHYLILAPVVAIYAIVNYHFFGSIVPVSGLAKSIGNIAGENFASTFLSYLLVLKAPLLVLVAVFVSAALWTPLSAARFKDELIILFIALFVSVGYYGTRSGWPLWPWYHWPTMMIFFYAVTQAMCQVRHFDAARPTSQGKLAYAALLALFAVVAYSAMPAVAFSRAIVGKVLHHKNPIPSFGVKNLELVRFIKENNFPKGSFFAMGDRAGSFGFFLGRDYRFFHTEGLVGPYEYYKHLKSDGGKEFLERQKVDYLIAERDNFFEARNVIGVAEPIQGLSSHFGPYLLCFDKSSIILDQTWGASQTWRGDVTNKRYLIDFPARLACSSEMVHAFNKLRQSYGALRKFTLPSEYDSNGRFRLEANIGMPDGWRRLFRSPGSVPGELTAGTISSGSPGRDD